MANARKTSRLKAWLAGGGVDIKSALLSGATANTNIAVTGLRADAQVIACIRLEGSATYAAPTDLQTEVSTLKGNIKLSTTDTTGDKLLLIYAQRAA